MMSTSSNNTHQWGIVGHKQVTTFLTRAFESGNIAHAYLITGPSGVGKKTLVRKFISQLIGDTGIQGDVVWVQRERDEKTGALKRDITVAQIREMTRLLRLTSLNDRYKVAVIADIEHLNTAASNSLLKILEEPARKTVLLLTSSEPESVLPTIKSRCQQLFCNPVDRDSIIDWLTTFEDNRDKAHKIAGYALGRPGYAYALYHDADFQKAISEHVDFFITAHEVGISESLRELDRVLVVSDSSAAQRALAIWQGVLRDMLLYNEQLSRGSMYRSWERQIATLAQRYSQQQLCQLISYVNTLISYIRYNGNVRLMLESFITQLAYKKNHKELYV